MAPAKSQVVSLALAAVKAVVIAVTSGATLTKPFPGWRFSVSNLGWKAARSAFHCANSASGVLAAASSSFSLVTASPAAFSTVSA